MISSGYKPSQAQLASFRRAPFAKSAWIHALYDENFSLLNKDRVDALSYVFGIFLAEANDKSDTSCPNPIHPEHSHNATGDILDGGASISMQILASPYGISYLALSNGREYRENFWSMARAGSDAMGFANGTGGGIAAFTAGRGERGTLDQAGDEDAKYLLAHYGGCSGPIFKRVYSGMRGFAQRLAPWFRPADGTPAEQIRVSAYKDNFWTKEQGALYYGYDVFIVNRSQLPNELDIMQSWKSPDDDPSAPPDVAPIVIALFSSDGKLLGESAPDAPFFVSTLYREVSTFSAPANHHPDKVYLEIYDEKHDKVYRSAPTPVPSTLPAPAN